MASEHEPRPMPHTHAPHLLNPLRGLLLSPGRLVRRLGLRPDARVLELGPGPGYFSPQVARAVPQGTLVLVDVQPEMLDMARERLQARGITNVEYRCADAVSLPVADGSCDVAFLVAVLGEIPDRAGCLHELHRALKPDGLLSITEMSLGDPDYIRPAELADATRAAGFEVYARYSGLFHYTLNLGKAPVSDCG